MLDSTSAGEQSAQAVASLANGVHLRQKRARSQLSCIPCRSGKLKCNRSHDPACDQCIKRNREGHCVYVAPPTKTKVSQNVKGRIRHLETLVVELMNSQAQKQSSTSPPIRGERAVADDNSAASDVSPLSAQGSSSHSNGTLPSHSNHTDEVDAAVKPFGQMRISKNGTSYVGESHWQTILDGIGDLKRDLGDDDDEVDEDDDITDQTGSTQPRSRPEISKMSAAELAGSRAHANASLGFMLGHAAPMTKEELIAAVPEKKIADRLLSLWFNSPDPFKVGVHAPTFQEEYRNFWQNPSKVPSMWLGLMFSILSLASSFALRDADESSPVAIQAHADVNRYHALAASAAIHGDFSKPKRYTVECLLLYSAGLRSEEAFFNVWLMMGVVIRIALKMGYHRDPANYPGISPFDGEMRRRVWAFISMIDVLISFQLGLPSMVKTIQSDVQLPRNLLDRDFHKNSSVIPPNRSVDELTPCSYVRAKLGLSRIFADAAELSHATIAPKFEEMMALDQRLEEAKALVPPLLQMREISELVTDPAEQLMCRFNLDLLYLKTKIIIHRRYMQRPFASLTLTEQHTGIGHSRQMCIYAALRVMQHHHTIAHACQPGGQLESVRWYMGSLSTHDFLLAAMIICLELSQQISNDAPVDPSGQMCPRRAAMMDALEKSQRVWSDASGRKQRQAQFVGIHDKSKAEHMYSETEKASRAMGFMLKKVRASFPMQAQALAQSNGGVAGVPLTAATESRPDPIAQPVPQSTAVAIDGSKQPPPLYQGLVVNYSWADMSGVPGQVSDLGHLAFDTSGSDPAVPALSHGDTSHPSSSDTSPTGTFELDYAMLGDMLDTQGSLDWQMLDGALQTSQEETERWRAEGVAMDPQQPVYFDDPSLMLENVFVDAPMMDFTTVQPELPMHTGASNVQSQPAEKRIYPGSWMSFPSMDTVNFDLGNTGS